MVNQNAQTRLNKVEEIVLKAIDELRQYLHNDGGDMELVEITDDNRVIVKLLGACQSCSVSSVTMKAGLEENLKILVRSSCYYRFRRSCNIRELK